MAKITTAQDLLKEKGYVANKFDTNGFLEAVADYFREHEVKDKLLLVSYRFLDVKTDDEILELAMKTKEDWSVFSRPYKEAIYWRLSTGKAGGWKAQTKDGECDNCVPAGFDTLLDEYTSGFNIRDIERPRIVVDSPYFKNALSLLQIMGGYVVEKKKRHGIDTALVSLI